MVNGSIAPQARIVPQEQTSDRLRATHHAVFRGEQYEDLGLGLNLKPSIGARWLNRVADAQFNILAVTQVNLIR
jgi:hypothetical protein